MHKKFLLLSIFLFILVVSPLQSAQKSGGIGLIINNPTGLSFKFADNGRTYFNGALSWSLKNDSRLYLHVDYIFKRFNGFRIERSSFFNPYMGLGLRVDTGSDTFGARVPFGIAYNFQDVPFDTFIELTPALDLIPETDFDLGFAIGIRFLF